MVKRYVNRNPSKRRGKLYYSLLFMMTLFIILPVIAALIISSHSLNTSSAQEEVSLKAALEMQMQYIQAVRKSRDISQSANGLNEGGVLDRLGSLKEMTESGDLSLAEHRLAQQRDSVYYRDNELYLYFAKSAYLMGRSSENALADAPPFLTDVLDELNHAGTDYNTARLGIHPNGKEYNMYIECLAPSVFYVYIAYGPAPNYLADILRDTLPGLEIMYYDAYGTVRSATREQTLIHSYDYNSLGNEDLGSFSLKHDGKPYLCFYMKYSNMGIKQAVFFVDEVAQTRQTVSHLLWISAAAFIIVFFLTAFYYARRLYRPLDDLITRLPAGNPHGLRDDYQVLSEAFSSMDSRLSEMDVLLRRSYLLRLLHGFDVTMFEDAFAGSGIAEMQGACVVAALRTDAVEDGTPPDDAVLEAMLCKNFHRHGYQFFAVKDGEFMLLAFCLTPQQSTSEIIRVLEEIQSGITEYCLSAYISQPHGSMRDMHTAYEEAIRTAEYCMLMDKYGTILCYDSIRDTLRKNSESPDFSQLRSLSENISALAKEETLNQFDTIVSEMTAIAGRPLLKEDLTFSMLTNSITMAVYNIASYNVDRKEIEKCAEKIKLAQDSSQLRDVLKTSMEAFEKQNDSSSLERERFDQIKSYICGNYTDSNLCLNLVSDKFGTCPSNITRMFKKYNNSGFLEYVHQLRVERAVTLLKESDLAVFEIAAQVGYTNTITMNRAFKNYLHSTPSLIRNKSRRDILNRENGTKL